MKRGDEAGYVLGLDMGSNSIGWAVIEEPEEGSPAIVWRERG